MSESSLEEIERRIQGSVKVINVILETVKKENLELQQILGMSYAKYVGLKSPFEEAVRALRNVLGEFNIYLKTVRGDLVSKYKKQRGI